METEIHHRSTLASGCQGDDEQTNPLFLAAITSLVIQGHVQSVPSFGKRQEGGES